MIDFRNLDVRHMTIGEMARLNGVSEQTLRLYEREGLFFPLGRDEQNGYRYYDIRQSAQLDIIRYMKELGMPLREIRLHMADWNPVRLKELLLKNRDAIDHRMKELSLQKRAVERAIDSCERYENAPPDGTLLLEYIPRRQMYIKKNIINFYDYEISEYEKILRALKEDMMERNIPPIYFANAGSLIRREDFLHRHIFSDEVFVFVDRDYVDEELITVVPPGFYLCIYCDRFDKEKEYIDRLLERIKEMNYVVMGDYICEVIMEMPMDYQERGMFLRLQVPVRVEKA